MPTFDEATDLFRNDPYCSCNYDSLCRCLLLFLPPSNLTWFADDPFGDVLDRADSSVLKRDSLEAKDIRSLTSSLALTAKSMQKNSKINGKDNSGSEITGQSMWSEDDSNQAEENIDEADASGKAQLDWVQCDSCKKWRTLPLRTHPKYPTSLDEDKGWICSMNSWAPHLAKCMVPEESMLSPTAIKIRVWLRRIRTGDRYEARNNLKSAYDKKTAGSNFIKSVPVDWIRCCSPVCGKWRACLRTMNGDDVRVVQYPWYCWMGSWDETKATCSAPQEGFGSQGYKVALTETSDKKDGPAYSNTVQNAANSNALNNSAANNSGGAKKSVNGRADNNGNDDTAIEVEAPEGGDDDESQPTIGISSRGRIVRSKFNVRKHLANSKKTF